MEARPALPALLPTPSCPPPHCWGNSVYVHRIQVPFFFATKTLPLEPNCEVGPVRDLLRGMCVCVCVCRHLPHLGEPQQGSAGLRAHSLGTGGPASLGSGAASRPFHAPLPTVVWAPQLGWASTADWGELGKASTLSASRLVLPRDPRMWELLRGPEVRKDSAAIRCDPGRYFSGADSPHKGLFVLSFPWLGLHCCPQRKA